MKNLTSKQVRRRRGYILIVILGFAAIVTTLGLAFLDSHSTAVPEAVNAYGAVRSQYLAESGVAIANHFLMYPPTTVSGCGYWTGSNSIAVDATNDYTNVSVVQDPSNSNTFTVTAVGVALNPDATVRGKRTITAKVVRPPGRKTKIPYALVANAAMCGSSFTIPACATPIRLYGDVHAEGGPLSSSGWCQGKVSSTSTVCWSGCGGTGPPASITENAASYTLPIVSATNCQTYTVKGTTYTALYTSTSDWNAADGSTITWYLDNGMSTNPGRVVYRPGNLKLRDNFVINGTLAITGGLTIDGTGIQITAVPDYPAMVVVGNMAYANDNRSASFIGSVLVGNMITDSNKNNAALSITGACYVKRGFQFTKTNGTYVFTWDCNRSTFWDFSLATAAETPITILSWKEN